MPLFWLIETDTLNFFIISLVKSQVQEGKVNRGDFMNKICSEDQGFNKKFEISEKMIR